MNQAKDQGNNFISQGIEDLGKENNNFSIKNDKRGKIRLEIKKAI